MIYYVIAEIDGVRDRFFFEKAMDATNSTKDHLVFRWRCYKEKHTGLAIMTVGYAESPEKALNDYLRQLKEKEDFRNLWNESFKAAIGSFRTPIIGER